VPRSEIEEALRRMAKAMDQRSSGIVLREVAGGWRLSTHPAVAEYLERFVAEQRNPRLTRAALETLAIIAYRQPVSRGQIAEIRGVSSETVIRTLMVRGLIQEVGRDPGPGLAILYGTTQVFLELLGINDLSDLPDLPDFMPDAEAVERMESGLGPGV
jgi:segregation and condensation protein B